MWWLIWYHVILDRVIVALHCSIITQILHCYLVSSHPVLTTIHCEIAIRAHKPQLPALIVMKDYHQASLCILLYTSYLRKWRLCIGDMCGIAPEYSMEMMYLHDNKNFSLSLYPICILNCYWDLVAHIHRVVQDCSISSALAIGCCSLALSHWCMHQWIWAFLFQLMTLRLFGARPIPLQKIKVCCHLHL